MNELLDGFPSEFEFSGVKGIDKVSITLDPNSKINVFIGNNGIGKTKTLECLFQALLLTNKQYKPDDKYDYYFLKELVFENAKISNYDFFKSPEGKYIKNIDKLVSFPVIYVPAKQRGYIPKKNNDTIRMLGEYEERKKRYFNTLLSNILGDTLSDSDNLSIEEWFIQRALSSNKYQEQDDNRENELLAVLNVLHKIDSSISNAEDSFTTPGNKYVSLTINNEKRRLNELSSGFASLIKIVQTIISGYAYFTNSINIENERGVVLIDEIESHLHISWQTRILPILSKVFPNTIFIIATHSSLVLSQLYNGKAYQLVNENGAVVNKEIKNPSNEAFVDLLSTAFNVNLNDIKLSNIQPERSKKQQDKLFDILGLSN